jgi:hypothetical protein
MTTLALITSILTGQARQVESRENLQLHIIGTAWEWDGNYGETISFKKDGFIKHPVWSKRGLITSWQVIDTRTVLLKVEKGRSRDLFAVLTFSEDYASFSGFNFHGGAKLRLSKKLDRITSTAEKDSPASLFMQKAEAEVKILYKNVSPEIKKYILWTARTFGRSGLWLNEDAFATMSDKVREDRIQYLVALFEQREYGRHLCVPLAEASALKDNRLVPGLMKVAGYHRKDRDYDCRPKWMAVAALARQESDKAVPLLISLVDHGNLNTRNWARAALSRKTGQDYINDKQAWAEWWESQGHERIEEKYLKPWKAPESK